MSSHQLPFPQQKPYVADLNMMEYVHNFHRLDYRASTIYANKKKAKYGGTADE
jgi:hypothetical protein